MSVRTAVLFIVVSAGAVIVREQSSASTQLAGGQLPAGVPFSTVVPAGDFIYLAGTLATDDNGKLTTGDIRAQTRQVLDTLAKLVKGAGSQLSQAAAVTVYLKNVADFPAMNDVYRTYWPADPPTRTTIITNLIMPDALVEMSMIAIKGGGERRVVHPAGWARASNPYSYGIQSGNTLFLAGLLSRNGVDNSPVAGDISVQTRTVLDNAGEILKAAGMTHADVASARVFLTDAATFDDMNAAYRTYFPANPPARATVKAGLTAQPFQIEITLTAVKDPGRVAITAPNADGTSGRPNPNLSSAIRVGNRLYLSGTLGATSANKNDARAQTAETMAGIGRTLKAAGFDWNDVVDGVVYLPGLQDFGAMNESYRSFFAKRFPARATVEAGLVSPDGRVEIMLTAVRR